MFRYPALRLPRRLEKNTGADDERPRLLAPLGVSRDGKCLHLPDFLLNASDESPAI